MLRQIRIIIALIFWIGISMLFLDFTGTVQNCFGWMSKIQFLPALLSFNFILITVLIIITLVFGRIYCSVVCPLGVMQDLIACIGRIGKRKRNKYSYSKALTWLRLSILILFILALTTGLGWIVALIDPYSSYGRIISNLVSPVYTAINNVFALLAEKTDSYAFYHKDFRMISIPVFTTACVSLIALTILAWKNGRTYCNTVCPVGTILGYLSKFSWFKPAINTNKCTNCGLCARRCKAACIDTKAHEIDYSRCVTCMDCIDNCSQNAIKYKHITKKRSYEKEDTVHVDSSRRNFLTATGLVLLSSAVKAKEKAFDGGLAKILDKQVSKRINPIIPPGAQSLRNLSNHCTSCQLCISLCPNDVLRPSEDMDTFMQPVSSYEKGFCRPECTICSDVCPTGAIIKIDKAEKSSLQIGHAVWIKENCLPLTEDVECGNCARHCPAGAITMIHSKAGDNESPMIPMVDTEFCIGCGACENLCPARPFSAIYVEGHKIHRTL